MVKLLNLVRNENMKLWRKRSVQIMLGFLLIIVIGNGLLMKFAGPSQPEEETNWRANLKQEIATHQKSLQQKQVMSPEYHKQQIALKEYRLENDLEPTGLNVWEFTSRMSALVMIVSLFTIIVAGGVVAQEFGWGTIKLLLIRPVKRSTILLSKYLSTLWYAIVHLVILFIVAFLTGGILFGFEGVGQPYLSYQNGHVEEVNMLSHVLAQYGLNCISLIMFVTFAIMISSVFRNSALAIGLSIFLMMAGSMIVGIFRQYGWAKYILFAHTNLQQYINGTPLIEGTSLSFALVILAIYYVVFVVISWWFFTKRDITA